LAFRSSQAHLQITAILREGEMTMTLRNESPLRAGGLETLPVLLSGTAFGPRLPEQLLSIAASLGMTLLTLTVSVS
jgi:hypothetical protein